MTPQVPMERSTALAPEERRTSFTRELIETIVLTLVFFSLIRSVVQNYRIEGISMEPNFHEGQFLVINKLAYRLGTPSRGDVIVFRYPYDPDRDFIKRVIGLPGDVVEVRQGQVWINGELLEEPYPLHLGLYSAPPVRVAPGHVYVLGDNRNNSNDSHTWGPLSLDLVIGKAVFSYWPLDSWGPVAELQPTLRR
ncbi:MAG: signal peptidase I [Anaerolineae bacterium]